MKKLNLNDIEQIDCLIQKVLRESKCFNFDDVEETYENVYWMSCDEITTLFLKDNIQEILDNLRKGTTVVDESVSDEVLSQWIAWNYKDHLLNHLYARKLRNELHVFSFSFEGKDKIYTDIGELYSDYKKQYKSDENINIYEWVINKPEYRIIPAKELFEKLEEEESYGTK